MPEVLATIYVCDDCLFAREGDGTESPDCEPWGLMPTADVANNCETGDDGNATCRFSWRDCDGCGSPLGGTRHRYAVFGWGETEAE